MDENAKLLVEITPKMLKTISACAVVRQARMRVVANQATDDQTWEIHDAAITEADRSYRVGQWAEDHLRSLDVDRIDDEWRADGYGRILRVREAERAAATLRYENAAVEISEGIGSPGSSGL